QFQKCKDYNKTDFYIITNIDRAADFIQMGLVCKKNNLFNKTFVLPIHHSHEAMNHFNEWRFSKVWPLVNFLGGTLFIEKLKGIYRGGVSKQYCTSISSVFSNYKAHIAAIITKSSGLICIANGEYENICRDFAVSGLDYFIVRNGVSAEISQYAGKDIKQRYFDVIVCGRVEERKNQIAIIESLQSYNLRILFLGGVNHFNKKYADKFFEKIKGKDNITHIDQVQPADVLKFYGNSKLSLSASWFEVSSLADIEASYCGCFIFSSQNGHSAEIIPDNQIKLVAPDNLEGLGESIISAIKLWEELPLIKKQPYTWEDSSRALVAGLKKYINKNT
ncbi:glycosyltransferase family 1 protein, partial [Escherichia coli]|nr:glycosyltransferase family 1 protein [Escherichia coli]